MIQLKPQEIFTIVRGLEDHTDGGTYYVQAVIRNARTDVLLDTVDLDDKGNGLRFSKEWNVPADTSGEGFYIVIIISVYTDSGYSTKSLDYGDRYDEYLIQERYNPVFGGSDVDYKKIKKMIEETVIIPKQKEIDFSKLYSEIKNLNDAINSIVIPTIPEQKEVDLSKIIEKLENVSENIKIRPQFEKTDLSPISGKLEEIKIKENIEETKKVLDEILENIKTYFKEDNAKILNKIEGLSNILKKVQFMALNSLENKEEPKRFRKL